MEVGMQMCGSVTHTIECSPIARQRRVALAPRRTSVAVVENDRPRTMSVAVMSESPPPKPSFTVSGNLVDLTANRIYPGTIDVVDGVITRVRPDPGPHDTYLLPGFVDAHIHVESSMLPPSEF